MYSRWNSLGSVSKWPTSHIKMADIQGSGGPDQMYFQTEAPWPCALPKRMSMAYSSANHYYNVSNFLINNRWYCMEARFKGSAPRNFTAWVDGVKLDSITPGSGTCLADYVLFGIINLAETGPDFDLYHWMDNVAWSSSRVYPSAVIEIGNSSDYASATKVCQEPIYLSDGSVQINADLAGLGSGPYYLWVTNNRQERSAAFSLSGTQIVPVLRSSKGIDFSVGLSRPGDFILKVFDIRGRELWRQDESGAGAGSRKFNWGCRSAWTGGRYVVVLKQNDE
jgi:hypothetical protein